jgi:DNA recombination protein RmuC
MDLAPWLTLALVVVNCFLVLWVALRRRDDDSAAQAAFERLERELREEVGRSAQGTRVELANALGVFQQTLQSALAGQTTQAQASREAQDIALERFSVSLGEQLRALSDANERRLAEVRTTVEQRLATLQQGNEQKLEQMRATVDEKLHQTLEARLGESFKQVADRLEQVHRGLGEMQLLAKDVGSLNRVLTNVKTRGIFGEVQLSGLLEQVFTPEQYATNVETVPASGARVEFAIKLPGRREDNAPLWLPIDCKFPREDYERLLEAQPHTTDFGIMFLPTEGLYAEALRRPGLVESLQRELKVMLTGPTTLLATLSSLQMGFRTLALEKRSAEVWEVLGAVKTEFHKFGDVLAKTKKKLDEASNTIDAAQRRTRAMTRSLKSVEAVPDARVQALIPGLLDDATEDEAA